MARIPKKVETRIHAGLKRFKPVIKSAASRDAGESDTVTIITDILADVFGYDKYTDITSEHQIRGTFCDLAITIDGTLRLLLEVKAIGIKLKPEHTKQAVDYAANQGIDWVVLTNGQKWHVYKVSFTKPIDKELVVEFDFCSLSRRNQKDIEALFLLCKEGWARSILGEFHTQKKALNRFYIGGLILSDPILRVMRRELKKLSPDIKVDIEDIRDVISTQVLKRDVVEGEKADAAKKTITRAARKRTRVRARKIKASTETNS